MPDDFKVIAAALNALASLREIEEVYLRTDDWRDDDRRVAFASLRVELQRQCEDLIRG